MANTENETREIRKFLGDRTRKKEGMENLARYAAMREKENYQGGNPFNQFIEDEKRGRMSPNKLDREKNKLRRDIALRKNFMQSARRENEVSNEEDLLSRDDGTFQGFLNNFPTLRSEANVVGRQVAKQKQEAALEASKDARVKVTKENAEAMQRGVDPALASAGSTNVEQAMERAKEREMYGGVGESDFESQINREKGLMNIGSLPPSERAKLESLEAGGKKMDFKDFESSPVIRAKEREREEALRRKYDRGVIGGGESIAFDDPEIAGVSKPFTKKMEREQGGVSTPFTRKMEKEQGGESIPFSDEMKKAQGGESLDFNSPEIAGEKLNLNDPENRELLGKIAPELAASMNMGDVENQMSEGMGKDEEARAVNEDLKGLSPIAQLDKDEQKEVLKEVAKASPDGKQSEEYLAAKEDTGDYIRYADGKFVLNKRAIRQDFQRKRNMDMLKDIPVANRAAMMASWGYIDSDDLSLAQKQSAKEIKEENLLDLKIAKATSDAEKAKNSLSDEDKVSFNLAQRGMQDAFTKGDYEAAEMYADQIKKIVPTYDNSAFTNLAEKRIKKSKEVTSTKIFKKYDIDGKEYYKARTSIIKTLSTLKGKSSGGLDSILGTAAPNGGTYADVLKNHGIYSWDKIAQDIVQGRPPAGVPKEALLSEERYMAWALPTIKSNLLTEMYGPLHGEIEAFHSPKMIKDRAVKRFNSTKDYSNPLGVSAEKVTPKKSAKVIKKVEASKSEKIGNITYNEKKQLRATKFSLSTKTTGYNAALKNAKEWETKLKDLGNGATAQEKQQIQSKINKYKKDGERFKKEVDKFQLQLENKTKDLMLNRELKAHNKKRENAGLSWDTMAEYLATKK
jgi:hypothetical protein